MSLPVHVTVNGVAREVPYGTTIARLVAATTLARTGLAVAVNEAVVPRGWWETTVLGDTDRVEILTAVQGG
jgi:sulfur carrier protein